MSFDDFRRQEIEGENQAAMPGQWVAQDDAIQLSRMQEAAAPNGADSTAGGPWGDPSDEQPLPPSMRYAKFIEGVHKGDGGFAREADLFPLKKYNPPTVNPSALMPDVVAAQDGTANVFRSSGISDSPQRQQATMWLDGIGDFLDTMARPLQAAAAKVEDFLFSPYASLESSKNEQLAGLSAMSDQLRATGNDASNPLLVRAFAWNAQADVEQSMAGVAQMPTNNVGIASLGLGFTPFAKLDFAVLAERPAAFATEPLLDNTTTGLGATGEATQIGAGTAQPLAEAYAQQLRDTLSRSQLPRAATAAVDLQTGQIYYGTSGNIASVVAPDLAARIPVQSLESWPVENCAEFNAANNALLNGASLENLEIHTVITKTGSPFTRCANCQITTNGATITSDGNGP